MLTNNILKSCIEDLKNISRIDLCVLENSGMVAATTDDKLQIPEQVFEAFVSSAAQSQEMNGCYLYKVMDGTETGYVIAARGGADAYMIGRIAGSQIARLQEAYKEKMDRSVFFQNLLMDNMLAVDIFNRAKKLHIESEARRAVFVIETGEERDGVRELLRGMYSESAGDYVVELDVRHIILVKSLRENEDSSQLEHIAFTIADMINAEAYINVRVGVGSIVNSLRAVSGSYKEADMALEAGRIFCSESRVSLYSKLGIGRLIYQMPRELGVMFVREVLGSEHALEEADEELVSTAEKFLENNLNVSETSRELYIHRNTLVYRLEKLQKLTGLDMRSFRDAMLFTMARMVCRYLKHKENEF